MNASQPVRSEAFSTICTHRARPARLGLLLLAAVALLGASACGTSVPQPFPGPGGNGSAGVDGNAGTGSGGAGWAGTGLGGNGAGTSGGWAGPSGVGGCMYDGNYYDVGTGFPSGDGCNSCSCVQGGLVACTQIACGVGTACGARLGDTCAKHEYCNFALDAICGWADATGNCSPRPDGCADIYSPVCGCDSHTYGNACDAAASGVSVQYEGECKSAGNCMTDDDCPQPSCACLDEDGDGTCDNHCPTFGCRNNQCVDIAPEVSCGGWNPNPCSKGEFCKYLPSVQCGAADGSGVCSPTPHACTAELRPVCGCDGKTYSNACGAYAQNVSVLHEGNCTLTD